MACKLASCVDHQNLHPSKLFEPYHTLIACYSRQRALCDVIAILEIDLQLFLLVGQLIWPAHLFNVQNPCVNKHRSFIDRPWGSWTGHCIWCSVKTDVKGLLQSSIWQYTVQM